MVLDPADFPGASPAELEAIEQAIAGGEAEYDPLAQFNELQAASARQEQQRQAEDQAEAGMPRRGSAENRLDRALQRIGRGTYLPGPGYASEAYSERMAFGEPGRTLGGSNCGPSHPANGACMSARHEMDCGSLASQEVTTGLQASGAYAERAVRQVTDASGMPVTLSDGSPATMADVIEAASGQRLRGAAGFETGFGRDEVAVVQRRGLPGDSATEDLVERAKQAAGILPQPTARERGLERLARVATATSFGPGPDRIGETRAERAERLYQPVQLRQADEPLNGSTGSYAAG